MPILRPSTGQALCERYGDRAQFLQTFAVAEQYRHARVPERCVLGSAPSLAEVNEAYGAGTSEEWLLYQLADLAESVGAREKINRWQLKQLGRAFLLDYGWMKITDVELYMYRLKSGEYGHFYGTVDTQTILGNMKWFMEERNEYMYQAIKREEQEQREHMMDGTVTWEEYHEQNPDMKYNPIELMAEAARLQITVTELLVLKEEAEKLQITVTELLKRKRTAEKRGNITERRGNISTPLTP